MRILAFSLVTFCGLVAQAQTTRTPRPPVSAPRVTTYDFPDEEIGVGRATPGAEVVTGHVPTRPESLVRIRADFQAALVQSAESI